MSCAASAAHINGGHVLPPSLLRLVQRANLTYGCSSPTEANGLPICIDWRQQAHCQPRAPYLMQANNLTAIKRPWLLPGCRDAGAVEKENDRTPTDEAHPGPAR